ncbi:MAG: sugar transferase [Chloroflexi bacterium]|nr:sugar transferase [Chloroflexota bacterium]
MIRRHTAALRAALMAADALSAMVLFLFIASIRFGPDGTDAIWNTVGYSPSVVAAAYGFGWVALLWGRGLYRFRVRWSIRSELTDIASTMVLFAVGTFSALFLLRLPDVSRLFLVLLFAAQPILTLGSRLILRLAVRRIRSRGRNTSFMIIVGTGREANDFADRIESHPDLGLRVIGHLSAPGEKKSHVKRPVVGSAEAIEEILHSQIVDEVAICLPVSAWGLVEPITRICQEEGRVVRVPLDAIGIPFPGGHVEEFDGAPVLSLVYGPDRVLGMVTKRLLDVVLSAAALLILSPVLLAIAVVVRLQDGSPVFFRQVRVGLHGRPFVVYKFRTMVPDAEARLRELQHRNEVRGHAFKLTADPRLSRIGRRLRRAGLDELPQLWNVLIGEMSLVGPRPPLPREVAAYDVWHRRRLSMKPGITGLWQIGTPREQDFDRWVAMDLDYIDRWSLWLDLKIMLRTIPTMLSGQGR